MPNDSYFATIRQLAEYEVWCNTESLNAASTITQKELFQEFPFGLKTIHRTLFHTLGVFGYWTDFIAPVIVDRWQWDYDSTVSIVDLQRMNAELSTKFMDAIDAAHASGVLHQDRRIVQVFHLVTHGTHHRTQFISMLRMLGKDPPFEAGDFAGWQRLRP